MFIVSEPTLLLRGLKSSELACLLALTLAGEPVRVSWLGRVTGLSPHTLTSAFNTLQALGLAQDDGQRSGWHLAASLQEQLLARAEALPAAGECHGSSPPGAGSKHACQALPAIAGSPPTSLETVFFANDRPTAQAAAVDGTRPGLPPDAALARGISLVALWGMARIASQQFAAPMSPASVIGRRWMRAPQLAAAWIALP